MMSRLMIGLLAALGAAGMVLASNDPPASITSPSPPPGASTGPHGDPLARPAPTPVGPAPGSPAPTEQLTPAAQADAPTSSASASTHEADAPSSAAPVANRADADSDALRLEKRMHSRGYATRVQNGEKLFCRREEVLGTRLGGSLHCMTAGEARANEAREEMDEELLRQRVMQSCLRSGNQGTKVIVNCGN